MKIFGWVLWTISLAIGVGSIFWPVHNPHDLLIKSIITFTSTMGLGALFFILTKPNKV